MHATCPATTLDLFKVVYTLHVVLRDTAHALRNVKHNFNVDFLGH